MADSPGGVEEGRASIRVVPDTSKFAADLRAQMEKLRREISLNIPVELDTNGLAEKAKAAVAEANAAAGKVHVGVDVDSNALKRVSRDILGFARDLRAGIGAVLKGASFAGIGVSALNAVPGILALAGSIAQLSGVVALLPAAFSLAATSIAALVVGMNGFGKALADIGDPKAFAQDLKDLTPAAQKAAKAFQDMLPQLSAIRRVTQQHLFKGLAEDIKSVASSLLPVLRSGLARVADSLNLIAHNAGMAIKGLADAGTLSKTFANIGTTLDLLAPVISDVITILGQLSAIGSSFLPALAGGLQTATTRFRDFLGTAKGQKAVTDFIKGALIGFGQLFSVIKSTARILGGLVQAAQAAGAGGLATLATTLNAVADVVNSPAFQTGLTQVFAGIQAGAAALATSLPAIGDALVAIAPVIGEFAAAIGTTLAAAIKAVAPALTILLQALAPQIIAGLQVIVPALVQGLNALAPALASLATSLAANKPLLAAVTVLALALVDPWLAVAGAVILVAANFDTLSKFFTDNVLPVLQSILTFIQPVIDAFIQLGTQVIATVQALTPMFEQIVAVVVQNWPQISQTVTSVMTSVRDIIVATIQIITQVISLGTTFILGVWAIFGDTILGTINRVLPAILQIIRGTFGIIAGVFQAFSALLRGDWQGLWDALGRIAQGQVDIIVGIVRGIGGLLIGAVLAIGDQLEAVGKAIIGGIVAGIKATAQDMANAVVDAAKGALSAVAGYIKKGSPSKLFRDEIGIPIAQGIAVGVKAGSPSIDKALITAVNPNTLATVGAATGGRGGAGVNIENVTVKDVDEMAEAISQEQRDAALVENLQLALVG